MAPPLSPLYSGGGDNSHCTHSNVIQVATLKAAQVMYLLSDHVLVAALTRSKRPFIVLELVCHIQVVSSDLTTGTFGASYSVQASIGLEHF